jgi:hypothetical protein
MTVNSNENATAPGAAVEANKPNDKEYNFRALEAKYKRELEAERAARLEAERIAQEAAAAKRSALQDDDSEGDDAEPYVDKKRLNRFGKSLKESTQSEIQKGMEAAKQAAKEELRQELWLESNPDFYDVLQHADKFAQKAPKLAEAILRMPEGFERQKLVYQNIKELGVDKPEAKASSVQEKIEANKKSPYYQPSGIAAAPYAGGGDFSSVGQKNAYAKMQELKQRLRL